MPLSYKIQRGTDWFKRFTWKQDGVPVKLNLNSANAELVGLMRQPPVVLPADAVRFGQFDGVVDVYFNAESLDNIPDGIYNFNLTLEYINGFTQKTDCIPVELGSCDNRFTNSWG